jgi:dihydroneopterin aldolase/2-amino-4-hydroxy-6-hydroxymethyldihydropteridine diphosphokinase
MPAIEPMPPAPAYLPAVVPDASLPVEAQQASLPADRMDVVPEAPVEAVIALGSNLGASQDILRDAVAALRDTPGIELDRVAPMARTAPVGGPDQQDFLNTVVVVRTTLSPRALLRVAQGVEAAFGRVRGERWGPRALDVDLITHGATIGVTDDLELPHPRAHERAFVLIPWAHVDPVAVLPGLGGGPVAVLAETAPDRDGIRWMALDWWPAEARP